ncbi:MAG TPA: ATP-binding protein [Vicinamibacterales bacterium]|jgi:heavy metal sensor kinase|nr:ATP-binding protein [Vicinamibacterales bacterium]
MSETARHQDNEEPIARIGLRLAAWYAVVFVGTSLAIVLLTYRLLAASLEERDQQLVTSTLREYSQRYAEGGLRSLADAVEIEQRSGRRERMFVRVVRGPSETLFLSAPYAWNDFDVSRLRGLGGLEEILSESGTARLEVASARLADGTLLQVGKSSENREVLLARYRTVLAIISLVIVAVALAGGAIVTRSTLQPIRQLITAVRGIVRTGRIDARVPVREERDAIDELSALFNEMLDRITTLIRGMEHALDNVAHDLRTPMTRLRGVAERALQSNDAQAHREALVTSLEESERILAMLDTLMDISEAETGTMRLDVTAVPLAPLVGEVVELYENIAEDKRISVSSDVSAELTIPADSKRLRQVLANLIDNAIKYTPPGGRVEVRARRDGSVVRLDVADSGVGIAPRDLPHIWERLYRGDQSRNERGLGLGLSLVRAIVVAHGGTVDVSAEPGRGATFTVKLPADSKGPSITRV